MLMERPKAIEGNPVNWHYLEGTSQQTALQLSYHCNQILMHGTRGPGKTDTQIVAFHQFVGKGYGQYWRGLIMDKEYKNLDDIVKKSKRLFRPMFEGAQFKESKSDYKWVWPSGEELAFRTLSTEDDYWNFHGHEYPFLGWNELTKYYTRYLYDIMMSTNRSSYMPEKDGWVGSKVYNDEGLPVGPNGRLPPKIPLLVFSTANPWGPGHTWVKSDFIDIAPVGTIAAVRRKVFNPQTQQEEVITKSQVHLFGSYKENPYLPPEYVMSLEAIKDPNIRAAWFEGNWDIATGGALSDVWDKKKQVVPRFVIPKTWRIDRTMDWGSTQPSWVGWFAEANGEEAMFLDGRTFCPPAGSVILIHEYYTTEKIGSNKGTMMGAGKLARKIVEIELELMALGWILDQPYAGPADNSIRNVIEAETKTIAELMEDESVGWELSDKSPGTRKMGLQLVREMLEAVIDGAEKPGLYIMDHCRAWLATVPILPRDEKDPDDVDTDAEDHPYDGTRYRILKRIYRWAKSSQVSFG
jgi:hypothetical protein